MDVSKGRNGAQHILFVREVIEGNKKGDAEGDIGGP